MKDKPKAAKTKKAGPNFEGVTLQDIIHTDFLLWNGNQEVFHLGIGARMLKAISWKAECLVQKLKTDETGNAMKKLVKFVESLPAKIREATPGGIDTPVGWALYLGPDKLGVITQRVYPVPRGTPREAKGRLEDGGIITPFPTDKEIAKSIKKKLLRM